MPILPCGTRTSQDQYAVRVSAIDENMRLAGNTRNRHIPRLNNCRPSLGQGCKSGKAGVQAAAQRRSLIHAHLSAP